ncbi:MAG: hypothetical protein OEZ23_01075 [Gammaproteobacteria bacterium]|nr:hypothetical protein [Gammaproteobacteria bacterium]
MAFKHGSAERNETESVLIEIVDQNGLTGYGEGCPRSYVTGESIQTALRFYQTFHHHFLQINNLEHLIHFVTTNKQAIDTHPAAWCALEMALLDLLGKTDNKPVEPLLHRNTSRKEYRYTAILGDNSPETFNSLYQLYRQQGFTDFKVKLSDDPARDREKMACMLPDASALTVRADANNLWPSQTAAIAHLAELPISFVAIEEPIQANQLDALESFAENTGTKVVLDESFLRADQIESIAKNPDHWIINARVSKMGGLLRSLDIIDALVALKVDITVGAQVGESSLLTRAALLLADAAGECLRAQEGAFGTLLLEKDLFAPMLQFGEGGKLTSSRVECRKSAGFGLELAEPVDQNPSLDQIPITF